MNSCRYFVMFLAGLGLFMQSNKSTAAADNWLTATVNYEGNPLALRVKPEINTPQNQRRFPQLVSITLQLAKVRADGMPDPDYNETLFDVDAGLSGLYGKTKVGVTVLVETLGGRRTFYSYAETNAPVEELVANLKKKFPGHDLSVQVRPDPNWGLFATYRKQFRW